MGLFAKMGVILVSGGDHRIKDSLRPRSRPIVGRPTVTIPVCILFSTVIPVTVEMMVKVFHFESTGYVISPVRGTSSEANGESRCELIRTSSMSDASVGATANVGGMVGAAIPLQSKMDKRQFSEE
jgi:hypothetical protein